MEESKITNVKIQRPNECQRTKNQPGAFEVLFCHLDFELDLTLEL